MAARTLLAVAAAVTVSLVASAAPGHAYTFADGYTGADYATGFPNGTPTNPAGPPGVGPVGLDFRPDGTLFVADRFSRQLFAFGPGGGDAGAALRGPLVDYGVSDLAFDAAGRLYVAQGTNEADGWHGDVTEIDPVDGHVIRVLASEPSGSLVKGMKVDPVSGDAFLVVYDVVTATGRIDRLTLPASGPGALSTYAAIPGVSATTQLDGLAFTRGGTLYVSRSLEIFRIAGVDEPQPPAVTSVATLPFTDPDTQRGDGIAVGQAADPRDPTYLLVNRNNGTITRVDFGAAGTPSFTDIMTGGTRGDSATVGPDGCLYADQTAGVLRVTNADGTCSLAPFSPYPPSATTGDATSRQPTGATLAGVADANGYDATAGFEYGVDGAALDQSTPAVGAGHDAAGAAVAVPVTGLKPQTTYAFRLVVTNRYGTSRGEVHRFTTPAAPVPPAVAVPSAAPQPPAAPVPVSPDAACAAGRARLVDVAVIGSRVRLLGVGPAGSAGRPVEIVLRATGRIVARTTVAPDLSFTASAPRPRAVLDARYAATIAGVTTQSLKLQRRMAVTAVALTSDRVRFSGTVTRPVAAGVTVRLHAAGSCSKAPRGPVIATTKLGSSGRFSLTAKVPAALAKNAAIYLSAETRVPAHPGSRTLHPTFTLVRGLALREPGT